jgi:two-component system sensor histidine kinase BaeS
VFLALATLLVLLLLIFTGFSVFGLQRGLGPYVAEIQIRRMNWLAEALQKKYATEGNWDSLRRDGLVWPRLQWGERDVDGAQLGARRLPPWYDRPGPPFGGPGDSAQRSEERAFLPPPPSDDDVRGGPDFIFQRLGVTDANGVPVAGAHVDPSAAARLPLLQRNRVIGYLVLAPPEVLRGQADRAFLARQSGFIALTGLLGLVLALVLSWLLARRWFAPIDGLTQAAQDIARGRLHTRVAVQGTDELSMLGQTFNSMAERLDTIETSRRAWLADVAHELRTPLAAMRAEIEALQDGVRRFDDKTALRLHRQVMRLGQLVDDLRSSMREPDARTPHDAPQFATVFPLTLLAEAVDLMRERFAQRDIAIDMRRLDGLASGLAVHGDAQRLHQVFMNLLENALCYTDAGGSVRLNASVEGSPTDGQLRLRFDDSAPGPMVHEVPRLFDRLFRGEASRNRETGGSGLGLSICRAIVEEHGGSIDASPSPMGGLRVILTLPLVPAP